MQGTPRILREKTTVTLMISLYCRKNHRDRERTSRVSPDGGTRFRLCEECAELQAYAAKRLTLCRFGEKKTTCEVCPVHCYAPLPREKIRRVMRYAGPRMLGRHPVLAVRHLLDRRKKADSQ